MDVEIIAVLAIFLCFFTPIAGLTLRLALKPLVDSVARLLEVRSGANAAAAEMLERRVQLLEQETTVLQQELTRVSQRGEFYDRLRAGGG